MLHPRIIVLVTLTLGLILGACSKPVDTTSSGEAGTGTEAVTGTETETEAEAETGTGAEAETEGEGGKTANPGRPTDGPPRSAVTWDEAPLELAFPTGDAQIFFGQGMCKPSPACQELKILKGEKDKPLTTCADVAKVIPILEEKEQALARVRFCTDHRYVLTDERCHEVEVGEDGVIAFTPPASLDLEAMPTSAPAKVVDFEGGFRVERTLLCIGDEADKLVQVAETVFTEGHMVREEVQVLIEAPMLVPRLK
jgi:hypothetical protein